MPIDLIPDPAPGSAQPVLRDKINEIISFLNNLELSLSGSGVVRTMWLTYDSNTSEILGQSGHFEDVTNGGASMSVTFVTPFAEDAANSYAVVAQITNVSGNVAGGGFSQITAQDENGFSLGFNSDDGNGGTPGLVHIVVAYSITV